MSRRNHGALGFASDARWSPTTSRSSWRTQLKSRDGGTARASPDCLLKAAQRSDPVSKGRLPSAPTLHLSSRRAEQVTQVRGRRTDRGDERASRLALAPWWSTRPTRRAQHHPRHSSRMTMVPSAPRAAATVRLWGLSGWLTASATKPVLDARSRTGRLADRGQFVKRTTCGAARRRGSAKNVSSARLPGVRRPYCRAARNPPPGKKGTSWLELISVGWHRLMLTGPCAVASKGTPDSGSHASRVASASATPPALGLKRNTRQDYRRGDDEHHERSSRRASRPQSPPMSSFSSSFEPVGRASVCA